jgi:hypothetical protein
MTDSQLFRVSLYVDVFALSFSKVQTHTEKYL